MESSLGGFSQFGEEKTVIGAVAGQERFSKMQIMLLSRFEVLALLPDKQEIEGFQIVVNPSGRTVLQEWTQVYETVVDGLPEKFHAKLAWHKGRIDLGILIFVRIGEDPKKQISFYLKPDPEKVKKRYRINPYKPKSA